MNTDLTRALAFGITLGLIFALGRASRDAVSAEDRDLPAAAHPAQVAHGVLCRVVRLLPVGERPRYREEFDAELYELAAAGVSRRAQLGYAVRVAARVWSLRRALRELSQAPGRGR